MSLLDYVSIYIVPAGATAFVAPLLEYMHGIREGGVLLLPDVVHSDCYQAGLGTCILPSLGCIALLR
jgi:hypothetical protein